MRKQAKSEVTQLGVDLFLRAAYQHLNTQQDYRAVVVEIEENQAREFLVPDGELDAFIKELRNSQSANVGESQPKEPNGAGTGDDDG